MDPIDNSQTLLLATGRKAGRLWLPRSDQWNPAQANLGAHPGLCLGLGDFSDVFSLSAVQPERENRLFLDMRSLRASSCA
jgi:hypothetical protein